MVSIKIDDILFAHGDYSTAIQQSKYIKWNRNFIVGNEDVAIYTDGSLPRVNNRVKTKIAWLLESPAVSAYQHDWIKSNHNHFDIVFTNNKDLLDMGEKFKFLPTGGCWIKPEEQRIYPKTKFMSMIASNKNWTDGHNVRNKLIDIMRNSGGYIDTVRRHKIDLYGRGVNDLPEKLDGLRDYMFSIVVENTRKDYYFTEKLIDCFATGTVPIYWGCPSIGKFFDGRGILSFDSINELQENLRTIDESSYNSMLEYIKINFDKAKEYMIAEDYMYEKYMNNYV